jgi:ArsR family transcriptional regulator, arsenate/arsenite/antimonite-responsive transcriptional repressor
MNHSELESYLKAIGEGTRLKILKFIIDGPLCICDLTATLDMSQPAVSQHMRRLKDENIVLDEKRGRWTYWSLNAKHPQYPILLHLLSLLPTLELLKQPCTNETEVR